MAHLNLPSIFILPTHIKRMMELERKTEKGPSVSAKRDGIRDIIEKKMAKYLEKQKGDVLRAIPDILKYSLNSYGFLFSSNKIMVPVAKEYRLNASKYRIFIIPLSADNAELLGFMEYPFALHSLMALGNASTLYDLLYSFYYNYFMKVVEYNKYTDMVMGFKFAEAPVNKIRVTKDKLIVPVTEKAVKIAKSALLSSSKDNMLDALVGFTRSEKQLRSGNEESQSNSNLVDVGQFIVLGAAILSAIYRNEHMVLEYVEKSRKEAQDKDRITNVIGEASKALTILFDVDEKITVDGYLVTVDDYYRSLIDILYDLASIAKQGVDRNTYSKIKAILAIIVQVALNRGTFDNLDKDSLIIEQYV